MDGSHKMPAKVGGRIVFAPQNMRHKGFFPCLFENYRPVVEAILVVACTTTLRHFYVRSQTVEWPDVRGALGFTCSIYTPSVC